MKVLFQIGFSEACISEVADKLNMSESAVSHHPHVLRMNGLVRRRRIGKTMHDANVPVFATPVYYYCVSGPLKTMPDHANPLFDTDYAFTKAYLLATTAEDAQETFAGTEKAVHRAGWTVSLTMRWLTQCLQAA